MTPNDPAFPTQEEHFIEGPQGMGPSSTWGMGPNPGMSLRTYLAAHAPAHATDVSEAFDTLAAASNSLGISPADYMANGVQGALRLTAKRAVQYADALIAELSNPTLPTTPSEPQL